jgi:collagenase-like PrtC family protease
VPAWSHPAALIVPSSVEIICDQFCENCQGVTTITFEDDYKLKRIGERTFLGSQLTSITITASTEEMDGSAFVGCPLLSILIAPGNRTFKIEGSMLETSGAIEIVRFFRREREVIIPDEVERLGKS